MFYGYWTDKTRDAMCGDESPHFKRILLGGPWKWTQHHVKGVQGVLAFRGELPLEIGESKTCTDGLLFFAKDLPEQADLAKIVNTPRFPLTLKCGRVIDIPLAVYAPRVLAFDSLEDDGEHATEFGKEAYRVWGLIESKDYPKNAEVKKLIFLAVQQCYAVTEELLSALGWITDADIVPIVLAISGRDPKSVAVANAISPSLAAAL